MAIPSRYTIKRYSEQHRYCSAAIPSFVDEKENMNERLCWEEMEERNVTGSLSRGLE
jgi:hypothetical protein